MTPPRVPVSSHIRPAQNHGVEGSPYAPTPETNRETASQREMVYAFGEIAKSFEGGMNKLVDITMEAQKQREAAASAKESEDAGSTDRFQMVFGSQYKRNAPTIPLYRYGRTFWLKIRRRRTTAGGSGLMIAPLARPARDEAVVATGYAARGTGTSSSHAAAAPAPSRPQPAHVPKALRAPSSTMD